MVRRCGRKKRRLYGRAVKKNPIWEVRDTQDTKGLTRGVGGWTKKVGTSYLFVACSFPSFTFFEAERVGKR
jgi:hypothetical protein